MSHTVTALLVAQTSIAHGDPGASNSSNVTPFRVQEGLYTRPDARTHARDDDGPIGLEPEELRTKNMMQAEAAVMLLATVFPLPYDSPLSKAIQQLQAENFIASAYVYTLIEQLNSLSGGEGEGLFSGIDRYNQLIKRLEIVSSQFASSFYTLHASLLNELLIESDLPKFVDKLHYFACLPRGVQLSAISSLGKNRKAAVTIARAWFDAMKPYRGRDDWQMYAGEFYNPEGRVSGTSTMLADSIIPKISENAMRHTIFRETLANHLLTICGLGSMEEVNSRGLVPPYVAMLLSNGGNMRAKAVAPDNSEAINVAIKRMFPSLDLVSGCVPTHMIGQGALSLSNWTLCLQNNEYTQSLGYELDIDAASLLSIETYARHTPDGMAQSKDAGQMLHAHTVMKKGAQVLVQFGFQPFTSELARGAAYFAFQEWLAQGGQVGGHEAQGEGRFLAREVNYQETECEELAAMYENYIEEHMEELREHLVSGSLGWKQRLEAWK